MIRTPPSILHLPTGIQGSALLSRAHDRVQAKDLTDGIEELFWGLRDIRLARTEKQWKEFVSTEHPIRGFIQESPLSKRAYAKPRGYPGDAVMLDYIYGCEALPAGTSEVGSAVFAWEFRTPGCQSVRARRRILAGKIDEVASLFESADVLSVACGHMREAALSNAVKEGRICTYTGFDQDTESLAVAQRDFGRFGIQTLQGDVRSILTGRTVFRPQNLICVSGLYDYLEDETASKLTRLLFGMLKPGGILLIANVAPNLPDLAYMQFFADWWLIGRSEKEVIEFASEIPERDIKCMSTFRDGPQNVVFLEVGKRD